MTFPAQARAMLYELQIGATDWANVTDYTFSLRQNTEITRGVPGEYAQSGPSTCGFQINNKLGYFSPRNPLSPLYLQIGRNTPVRVSIGEGAYGMVLSGINGRAEAADTAATSIAGDIDIRVDMELLANPVGAEGYTTPDSWTTGDFDIASKWNFTVNQLNWALILIGGNLRLAWYPTGTTPAVVATSTVPVPGPAQGRRAVRATLDVNNGAAGNTVTFYTAPTMAGPWTQLGATVTQAGVTSIFDGTAPLRIGSASQSSSDTWGKSAKATVYAAELRNGIGGTVVASPDFAARPLDAVPFGTSNFADAQGNNWIFNGFADAARIWYGNVDIRFWGECSAFPNEWDISGNDAWVQIEAAGFLRRFGQGQDPAKTGLRDWIESQSPLPVSYFPLSGDEGTTYSVNQGRTGKDKFRFFPESQGAVKPVFAYGKDFGTTYLGSGMELNATGDTSDMHGDVGVTDDNFTLDFVFQSPVITTDTGVANTNMGVLKTLIWTYDYDRWQLQLQDSANGGTVQISWFANDGLGSITYPATVAIPALQDNDVHTCRFQVDTTGGGISQRARVWIDGVLVDTRSVASGRNINGTSLYQMFYSRYAGQTVMTLGHLTGWAEATDTPPPVADFDEAARGYAGELAADRMERLAAIGNINLTVIGSNADTMAMGPQYSEAKLTQLRDAENADMGFLLEPRSGFGLEYRTRVSMVSQTPALTLNYALGQIVPPFKPTDDDLLTKNDVLVSRRDGDSYRYQLQTGRLSILNPPAGVGSYADSSEINVETDAMLPAVATWLVNRGTVDAARYPSVTVDLGILAGFGLDVAARGLDTGDLLVITAMDACGVYEDVRLLVLGTGSETISDGAFKHLITWNCAPYQSYEGAVFATSASVGSARFDSTDAQLNAAVPSTATTFAVKSTTGALWTTDPAALPLDVLIGGERMTVGAISGASSPQTFSSVTRSVNGVVKAQTANTDVRLADPAYYSL